MLEDVINYDAATGGSAVNEVEVAYNDFGLLAEREMHMRHVATLIRVLKPIVFVLLLYGLFFAYYMIARIHFRLSTPLFVVGCMVLFLVVLAVSRKYRQSTMPTRSETEDEHTLEDD